MADDKLPCARPVSISATRSDKVLSWPTAISLSPFQKASSRLTLVLWPAMTIERLMTGDFIACLPFRSGGGRDFFGLGRCEIGFGFVRFLSARERRGSQRQRGRSVGVWPVFGRSEG